MKKTIPKLLLPLLLMISCINVLMAQDRSNYTDSVIQRHNYERDADTVGLFLNRGQTIPNYFRSSFLYIHDELQDQLDLLISNSPLPQKNLAVEENRLFLEEYIASEARIAAKLAEVNIVSKAIKVPGKAFLRPEQLLSDWHLRSKYHELAKAYVASEKFSEGNWSTFKPLYDDALGGLETELRNRGIFPKSTRLNASIKSLLGDRFNLIEEFNLLAKQEAMNFIDASPLLIENRVEMAKIAAKVDLIDENLGIEVDKRPGIRDLLTEETIRFRLETLEHGKSSAEKKSNVMRHFDSVGRLHIVKIDEQLAEDKKWLYMEKNHQVIGKGYSNRGPPTGDSPNFNFEDTPYPQKPSPGGTLGDFISEAKSVSIDKDKQKEFERIINKQAERFKAFNLTSPSWENYKFHVKPARSIEFNTLESFLRSHARCYFERLPTNPVEANKHKAVFETIAKEIFGENNAPKITTFIVEPPVELIQYQQRLEQRMTIYGSFAAPGELIELTEIENHIKDILNRDKIPIEIDTKMGGYRNRPPPSCEEIILKIYDAEIKGLRALAERYGSISTPSSIEIRLKEIDKIRSTNEVATALQGYRQFTEMSSVVEVIKYLDPESEIVKTFETGRQTWATEFDNIFKKASFSGSSELPTDLYENAKNARNSLSIGKKAAQSKLPSRPSQDLEKFKDMTVQKTPGGIWLSPEGFQIQPQGEFEFTWILVEDGEGCPIDQVYSAWPLDSLGLKTICFPENLTQPNTQHWLNQIRPW